MSEDFHNRISVKGSPEQRRKLLAEVFTNPPANWDWVGVEINSVAYCSADSGESQMDFYSLGFPVGLDILMEKFPEIVLDCKLLNMGSPQMRILKLKGNEILEESCDDDPYGEYDEDPEVEEPN